MTLSQAALDTLKRTSRTFYIPISRLPSGLQEAIGSAYLCMRAIDEIEDHPLMVNSQKVELLHQLSVLLQAQTSKDEFTSDEFQKLLASYPLPEVSLRIPEWAFCAPASIAPRIWEAVAAMADRMAYWANNGWTIRTKTDLDAYTYSVAGAVGILLCDIWAWFDNFQMERSQAILFGRGLQLVNILRNRREDGERNVNFFPHGWELADMQAYTRQVLDRVEGYIQTLPTGVVSYLIKIPFALAQATLNALETGREQLTRTDVMAIVQQLEI